MAEARDGEQLADTLQESKDDRLEISHGGLCYASVYRAAFTIWKDWFSAESKRKKVERIDADQDAQAERKFKRVGDSLLVSYSIGDDFSPEFTETYDIALGGLAMLTNADLEKEKEISVQLELRGDTQPILRLRGIVRWSRYDAMLQRYRTGVAFLDVDELTRAHLQRYIDTLHLLRDMGML